MQVITIGFDLAKNVFQVHGVDANDKVMFNKQLRRSQVLPFFAKFAPCLIGMEACASAHYWARELKKLGHDVRLMPAKDVKAYVKRNKNDAVDAAACCEAVRRPTVRTVPVKTPEQQAQLMQHRVRDLLVRQRTQTINALRSHLAELGIVAAQGYDGLKALLSIIADENDARIPEDARASLSALVAQIASCQAEIGAIEKRLFVQRRALIRCSPRLGITFLTCWMSKADQKPRSIVCVGRCKPRRTTLMRYSISRCCFNETTSTRRLRSTGGAILPMTLNPNGQQVRAGPKLADLVSVLKEGEKFRLSSAAVATS